MKGVMRTVYQSMGMIALMVVVAAACLLAATPVRADVGLAASQAQVSEPSYVLQASQNQDVSMPAGWHQEHPLKPLVNLRAHPLVAAAQMDPHMRAAAAKTMPKRTPRDCD